MKPNPKRRPKKLAARAAALKQHRKTAEIGIDPKYANSSLYPDSTRRCLSPEWLKKSLKWDRANTST